MDIPKQLSDGITQHVSTQGLLTSQLNKPPCERVEADEGFNVAGNIWSERNRQHSLSLLNLAAVLHLSLIYSGNWERLFNQGSEANH